MTDLETFKQEVAQWLEENCPASMRRPIVSEEMVWGSSRLQFMNEDQKLWFERMRDRGWFAPSWPREYGGGGLTPQQARILDTEMARLGCRQPQYNLGVWMLGPVLVEAGTHEQKLEHLVPMTRGEQRWCQGFSEPNAGSDLASLKTSARRVTDEQGDAYIVNGGKIWTSDGDKGDWMYALVRTSSEGRKQDGISFLLIDMKSPGVTVKPIELISGKSSFCQVFFDDVRVPVRQLVGREGEGWALAKKLLQHERAAMSKFTEGGAPSHDALATALPYMLDEQGQIRDGALRDRLAGLLMDAQAFALTHRRVTEKALARQDVTGPSSIMKLVQTEQEVAKYELLQQVLGLRGLGWEAGNGLTAEEIEVGRAWLRSKSYTIAGGSSEVQLNIIAKRVLELP
ncbi:MULTISPECIES: acyl-CoA dehydrogenase family protein [Comamonas]|uniref:acyl-CoA dehydrogenase family protein n=1 Tax=Comamonas TaxID=283 RepID=UPI0012CB1135|nr:MULTISPECIES: acyl-CoA dehydrogenase family protein [Comamonas]MEB5967232.1 acyl-CoA dehydrogenase family protein [Comamonas testosteroni]MPS93600.1 acyl-CoA dehydrogenase [Comamonas sp.]